MILVLLWLTLLFLPERLVAQEKYIASYAGFAGFQAPAPQMMRPHGSLIIAG